MVLVLQVVGLLGCAQLPTPQLQPVTICQYQELLDRVSFDADEVRRYCHSIRWPGKDVSVTGVVKREAPGTYVIAGMTDAGITLYVARLENGRTVVLENRMGVSDRFLEENIFQDMELWCMERPPEDVRFYREKDDSLALWMEVPGNRLDYESYFVYSEDKLRFVRIRKSRLVYDADIRVNAEGQIEDIVIDNLVAGYRANIRILKMAP